MLGTAIIFLLIAMTAPLVGQGPVLTVVSGFAEAMFYLFLTLFLVSLLFAVSDGNKRARQYQPVRKD